MEILDYEPKDVILHLFRSRLSSCLLIMGRRDTGKTDMSLLIAETVYDNGILDHIATNIKIYGSPFEITQINYLDDLQTWCKETRGKKLYILDEAGKSVRRRTPMSKINIQFLDQLQILRKYKLSLILIAPSDKYLDSVTLGSDVLDAQIVKPYYNNRKVALYEDLLENYKIWFSSIPATSINFDTWDIAPFGKSNPEVKFKFKEGEKQLIWEWVNGKTYRELGVHNMKINRLLKKYLKPIMEKELQATHITA